VSVSHGERREDRDEAGWCVLHLRERWEIPELLDTVVAVLTAAGFSRDESLETRLALEEALCNALQHGNRGDPSKRAWLRYRLEGEWFLAEVEDQGEGFDPAGIRNPVAPENVGRPCGRGLLLMSHATTWLRFNARGNRVRMGKRRSAGGSGASA
jgi:serine/threonine-protein kinase RsbW